MHLYFHLSLIESLRLELLRDGVLEHSDLIDKENGGKETFSGNQNFQMNLVSFLMK